MIIVVKSVTLRKRRNIKDLPIQDRPHKNGEEHAEVASNVEEGEEGGRGGRAERFCFFRYSKDKINSYLRRLQNIREVSKKWERVKVIFLLCLLNLEKMHAAKRETYLGATVEM